MNEEHETPKGLLALVMEEMPESSPVWGRLSTGERMAVAMLVAGCLQAQIARSVGGAFRGGQPGGN